MVKKCIECNEVKTPQEMATQRSLLCACCFEDKVKAKVEEME